MATIYERTQLFQQRNGTKFGRRKYKGICHCITKLFQRKHPDEILPLVESIEGDKVFQVNNYPDRFITVIDGILFRIAAEIKANKERSLPCAKLTIETAPAPVPKKERKRIPAKKSPKPLYSTRNYKQRWL